MPAELADEDFRLAEQSQHLDPRKTFAQEMERRRAAGEALLAASVAQSVRRALVARNRPQRREFELGEWVYYWRKNLNALVEDDDEEPAAEDEDKMCWHGPALVGRS